MLNIGQMMKQVQTMQTKMADMQDRLGEVELTGSAGGNLVIATMNGKGDLKAIKIDPKAVDPADIETLEDLIVAALSDAKTKMESLVSQETEKAMGGMKLPPGFKLPL